MRYSLDVRTSSLLLLVISCVAYAQPAPPVQFGDIGDLKLQSGESIRNCRVGYRTFGKLNESKSNAVLFPTWFSGTSEQIAGLVRDGGVVDPAKYFVIAVDALGDGVSSSPSNSKPQPRMRFPKISIHDMVESQHRLLTQVLKIGHLKAVIGISMGGMQTFQWAVDYPDFLDYAVPLVGSPRLTSYDLLLWNAELHAIQEDKDWNHGDYRTPPPMRALTDIHQLALKTPANWVRSTTPGEFAKTMKDFEDPAGRFDINNWVRQLEAMIGHDIARDHGGTLEAAAEVVKAKMLIITSSQDHMVNPTTANRFAHAAHARLIELNGDCGHIATSCQLKDYASSIDMFLAGGL